MKVNPIHLPSHLVEADVVEALEARTVDGPNAMVRDQKVLLPAHKYVFAVVNVNRDEAALSRLLLKRPKGGKLSPVRKVDLIGYAP